MKKFIIILTFMSFCTLGVNNIFSQPDFEGDLALSVNITSPCTITITMELSSIPFEGRHNLIPGGNNRLGEIYNGSVYRLFNGNNVQEEHQIYYHKRTQYGGTMIFDLGSCNELPDPVDGAWGYARYKITYFLDYESKPSETYVFYFNALDSKYGKLNYPPPSQTNLEWYRYSVDWEIEYREDLKKILIKGTHYGPPGFPSFIDRVFDVMALGQQPEPEFKVWELLGSYDKLFPPNYGNGWNSPWRKEFFAHSTPFPVSQTVAQDSPLRVFTLGTKVIMDEVFENTGYFDIYGYNTQMNPYYNNTNNWLIPAGYNDPGNTYCTPASYNNELNEYGIKLIAESGDTLILKNNKKLWISAFIDELGYGDTIHFKPNSTLILEPNAGVFPTRGGVLINEGANVVWNNPSSHRVFESSELYYTGNNTVNNGGYIEVDANAKLKLGDNTTLTFDGSNSYLKLKQNAQVELGSNAKIEFKEGAYINARYVTFDATGSSPWEGLYFENAGSQTKIRDCTFNTVKNPIKIVNTNTNYMSSSKEIKNNVFNLHQNGSHCVYAENVFNILIDGNTFNIPQHDGIFRTGTYLRNSYNTSSN